MKNFVIALTLSLWLSATLAQTSYEVVDQICMAKRLNSCVDKVFVGKIFSGSQVIRVESGFQVQIPSLPAQPPFVLPLDGNLQGVSDFAGINAGAKACEQLYGPTINANTKLGDCIRTLPTKDDVDGLRRDIADLVDKVLNKNFGPAPAAVAPSTSPQSTKRIKPPVQ